MIYSDLEKSTNIIGAIYGLTYLLYMAQQC